MLVLTRQILESIMIGDEVEITVLAIKGNQVRFGIEAPYTFTIYRKDIIKKFTAENEQFDSDRKTELTVRNF